MDMKSKTSKGKELYGAKFFISCKDCTVKHPISFHNTPQQKCKEQKEGIKIMKGGGSGGVPGGMTGTGQEGKLIKIKQKSLYGLVIGPGTTKEQNTWEEEYKKQFGFMKK